MLDMENAMSGETKQSRFIDYLTDFSTANNTTKLFFYRKIEIS